MSYDKEYKNKREECFIELQPNNFQLEPTTIWSFPDRGRWATHSGKYRGNWTPYVPRNLILRYSKPGDWILDQFTGSGTTLVEAKLLNRNAVGVDINPQSVSISEKNIQFDSNSISKIYVREGDATKLDFIKDGKSFISEINSLKLLNNDYFLERIQHILNNTNRKQIAVSLGFYVEFKISMEELKKADGNFSSKNDIDELAKPLYDLIMECKNIIEK